MQAVYQDLHSLSYVTAIAEDLWFLMIDSSRYKNNNAHLKSDATSII